MIDITDDFEVWYDELSQARRDVADARIIRRLEEMVIFTDEDALEITEEVLKLMYLNDLMDQAVEEGVVIRTVGEDGYYQHFMVA